MTHGRSQLADACGRPPLSRPLSSTHGSSPQGLPPIPLAVNHTALSREKSRSVIEQTKSDPFSDLLLSDLLQRQGLTTVDCSLRTTLRSRTTRSTSPQASHRSRPPKYRALVSHLKSISTPDRRNCSPSPLDLERFHSSLEDLAAESGHVFPDSFGRRIFSNSVRLCYHRRVDASIGGCAPLNPAGLVTSSSSAFSTAGRRRNSHAEKYPYRAAAQRCIQLNLIWSLGLGPVRLKYSSPLRVFKPFIFSFKCIGSSRLIANWVIAQQICKLP